MRNVFIIWLVFVAGNVMGQTMSPMMTQTEQACLCIRNAVMEKSADKLMTGMEMIGEIPFKTLTLAPVNTKHQVPLKGHLLFNTAFLDSLLLHNFDFSLIQVEGAFKMRGGEGSLRCAHQAVAAQNSVSYSVMAQGVQELMVIAEDKGFINLYVNDVANGKLLEDKAEGGKQVCRLKWNVEKVSNLEIKIENISEVPISFIVLSN